MIHYLFIIPFDSCRNLMKYNMIMEYLEFYQLIAPVAGAIIRNFLCHIWNFYNRSATSGLKREWKVGILPVRRTVSSTHGYTFCLEESELRERCSWAVGKWWKSRLLGLRSESSKIEKLENHLDRDGYVDRKCSLSVSHIIAHQIVSITWESGIMYPISPQMLQYLHWRPWTK